MKKYALISKNSFKILLGIVAIIIFFITLIILLKNINTEPKSLPNKNENEENILPNKLDDNFWISEESEKRYTEIYEKEMEQEDEFLPPTTINKDLNTILKEIFDILHKNKDNNLRGRVVGGGSLWINSVRWFYLPYDRLEHDQKLFDKLPSFYEKITTMIDEAMIKNGFYEQKISFEVESSYLGKYKFYKKNNLGCFLRIDDSGNWNKIVFTCDEDYQKIIQDYKKYGVYLQIN